MKALSVLQPWAWLILRPDIVGDAQRLEAYRRGVIKDVENRTWSSNYRGRILVHAGKSYTPTTHAEYSEGIEEMFGIKLPHYVEVPRGGIVGEVLLTSCGRHSASRWAVDDSYHWSLENARPRPFVPWRGQLGLFEVDEAELERQSLCIDLLTKDPI